MSISISPKNDVSCNDAKHICCHIQCISIFTYLLQCTHIRTNHSLASHIAIESESMVTAQYVVRASSLPIQEGRFGQPSSNILASTKSPVRMYVYGEHKLEFVMDFCMRLRFCHVSHCYWWPAIEGKLCGPRSFHMILARSWASGSLGGQSRSSPNMCDVCRSQRI